MLLKELKALQSQQWGWECYNKFVGRNAIIFYLALSKVIDYIGLINAECMSPFIYIESSVNL